MRTLGGKRLAILLLALTPVIPVQAAEDDSLWDKVKDQGTKWYEDAKDKAPEVYDDLKEKGGELYDKAKEKAPELKDKATDKLGEAQQNVQEFRENQESEFWQRFEEQVGVPVGPNSVQTVEPETTSETTAESSTVSEYGQTIPETVVDTVLEDPQAVSSVENHSDEESNSQSSSTLIPIIAITTIAANLVGTVAMIIVSIMLVRRMPRKPKH